MSYSLEVQQSRDMFGHINTFLTKQEKTDLINNTCKTWRYILHGYTCIDTLVKKELLKTVPDYPASLFSRPALFTKAMPVGEGNEKALFCIVSLAGANFGTQEKELVNFRVKQLLDCIECIHQSSQLQFKKICLDNTHASFNALTDYEHNFLPQRKIEILSMNNTLVSDGSLFNLVGTPNLTRLHIDNCAHIIDLTSLNEMASQPAVHLKELSIVNHRTDKSKGQLDIKALTIAFPQLTALYVTLNSDCAITGLEDPIEKAPMRSIKILPCGHGVGTSSWKQLLQNAPPAQPTHRGRFRRRRRAGVAIPAAPTIPAVPSRPLVKCMTCRNESDKEATALTPRIIKIYKDHENKVLSQVVDCSRNPLEGKTLFHKTCGEGFNATTYPKDSLIGKKCSGCKDPITSESMMEAFLATNEKLEPSEDFADLIKKIKPDDEAGERTI